MNIRSATHPDLPGIRENYYERHDAMLCAKP